MLAFCWHKHKCTHIRQQQSTLGQDEGKHPSDPHISLSRVHMKAFTNAAGCEAQP